MSVLVSPIFAAKEKTLKESAPLEKRVAPHFERLISRKLVSPKKVVTRKTPFSMTIRDYLQSPVRTRVSSLHRNKLENKISEPPVLSTVGAVQSTNTKVIPEEIQACIRAAGQKYNVPENLIQSIVRQESAFNPKAKSQAGAMGLMQLMPGTARDLGVKNPFDVRENINGGVKYFRQMLDRFKGDHRLALAAYNAGPGAVLRHGGVPPYPETRNYVTQVLKHFST